MLGVVSESATVGRAGELALGRRLVDDLRGVHRQVRLVASWVAAADGDEIDVIVGSCDELKRERPFGALIRTLTSVSIRQTTPMMSRPTASR